MYIRKTSVAVLALLHALYTNANADGLLDLPRDLKRIESNLDLARAYGEHQALRQALQLLRKKDYSSEEISSTGLSEKVEQSDRKNAELVKKILDQDGWPSISKYGPDADMQSWLFVLYAGHDLPLQERALLLIEKALIANDTRPANFAYLWDRVQLNKGYKQKFGTQGQCIDVGKWEADPIEDPENINERREKFKIGTFEQYVKLKSLLCRNFDPMPNQKKKGAGETPTPF